MKPSEIVLFLDKPVLVQFTGPLLMTRPSSETETISADDGDHKYAYPEPDASPTGQPSVTNVLPGTLMSANPDDPGCESFVFSIVQRPGVFIALPANAIAAVTLIEVKEPSRIIS